MTQFSHSKFCLFLFLTVTWISSIASYISLLLVLKGSWNPRKIDKWPTTEGINRSKKRKCLWPLFVEKVSSVFLKQDLLESERGLGNFLHCCFLVCFAVLFFFWNPLYSKKQAWWKHGWKNCKIFQIFTFNKPIIVKHTEIQWPCLSSFKEKIKSPKWRLLWMWALGQMAPSEPLLTAQLQAPDICLSPSMWCISYISISG